MAPFQPATTGELLGLNEDENPRALAQGELTRAFNVARRGRMTGTRPGLVRPASGEDYDAANDGGNDIQGGVEYRRDFDEGRRLITVGELAGAGRVFYEHDQQLPAGPTITGGQDNIWVFGQDKNLLLGAGGAATDDLWSWDGVVANAPAAIAITNGAAGAQLYPQYVIGWRNYVLVNGLRGGTLASDNPACTRYCDFGTDPTTPANWAAGNTIGFSATRAGIDSFGATFTTGFGTYRDNNGDWLLILTNRALFAVLLDPTNDFRVSDAISNGCVHQRAFVPLGLDSGDAIYVSQFGVHSLRQSQNHGFKSDKFLSWKIRETFRSLRKSRLKFTTGAYDSRNGRVVFAVTTTGNNAHDLLLSLDVRDQRELTAESAIWHKWQIAGGVKVNHLFSARDESDEWYLYAGTTTGDVVRFDESTYKDLDQGYGVELQTRHDDSGNSLIEKGLGDVILKLSPVPSDAFSAVYRTIFDYGRKIESPIIFDVPESGEAALWGSAVWGESVWGTEQEVCDVKLYGCGQGRSIAHNIQHSGEDEPILLGPIDYQVEVTGESRGDSESS